MENTFANAEETSILEVKEKQENSAGLEDYKLEEKSSFLKKTALSHSENSESNGTTSAWNPDSSSLDKELESKLRGDAIGSTLYSESFVLKALMHLLDLKWDETVEDDLCVLWDMTLEKDICEYLISHGYTELVCKTIVNYPDEKRCLEIVIGILANMLSKDCSKCVDNEDVNIILSVVDTDDPFILIQVMRFIKGFLHTTKDFSVITEDLLEKFAFILDNSLNKELLLSAMDTLSNILCDHKLPRNLVKVRLLETSFVAYFVICEHRDGSSEYDIECPEKRNVILYFLSILTSFAYYANTSENAVLYSEVKKYEKDLIVEIRRLLHYFEAEENLFPVSDNFNFYIEHMSYSVPVLNFNYDSECFRSIIKIIDILSKNDCLEENSFGDLFCYFISVGNNSSVKKDLQTLDKKDAVNMILKFTNILEKYGNSKCSYFSSKNYIAELMS